MIAKITYKERYLDPFTEAVAACEKDPTQENVTRARRASRMAFSRLFTDIVQEGRLMERDETTNFEEALTTCVAIFGRGASERKDMQSAIKTVERHLRYVRLFLQGSSLAHLADTMTHELESMLDAPPLIST